MPRDAKTGRKEELEKPAERFADEDLEQVAGGKSIFADIPRIPLKDYDDEVKSKI